jgi:YfiH family protein
VLDLPWTCLRQVHGTRVVHVEAPGAGTGEHADASVTTVAGAPLAVFTADCASVALAGDDGVVAAVHAGWRGLVEGVVEATVARLRELGATSVVAALGPCIHVECYEFGEADLATAAARLGDEVRGRTAHGRPALDVPAAVRAALRRAGAALVHDEDACTACEADRYYSHRARGEVERQAMVVWKP